MREDFTLRVIAHIKSDFTSKFGIPRQSGLAEDTVGMVVFTPQFRDKNALRGIDAYSHLWLIWGFSEIDAKAFSPTVRPPRLGGNTRVGVFATRSPNRPNPLGLSSVRLLALKEHSDYGTVLIVSGADLMDGTPIYDIKPYLSFTDSHADAKNGFAAAHIGDTVQVDFPEALLALVPQEKQAALLEALSLDPRPAYKEDGERIYGFPYAGLEIRFRVQDGTLHVCEVTNEA